MGVCHVGVLHAGFSQGAYLSPHHRRPRRLSRAIVKLRSSRIVFTMYLTLVSLQQAHRLLILGNTSLAADCNTLGENHGDGTPQERHLSATCH